MITLAQWTPTDVLARGRFEDFEAVWRALRSAGPYTLGARVESPLEQKLSRALKLETPTQILQVQFTQEEWQTIASYLQV